jgi:hypothetical protein
MRRRSKRFQTRKKPRLTERQILAWCDDHHENHGTWPRRNSGPIRIAPETWTAIEIALRNGNRGLPGGSSLAQLLANRRGVRNRMGLPPLTKQQILDWTRKWFRRNGQWPMHHSGVIPNSGGETWSAVARALSRGGRGLPGGSTLARFFEEEFGVPANRPPVAVKQILAWADAHRAATSRWPTRASGTIAESSNESWSKINTALINGLRGLPGGSSLAKLLARHRGVRNRKQLPKLTRTKILRWAKQYVAATGRRPTHLSGPVVDGGKETGETWGGIDAALKYGGRGLAGKSSLYRLMRRNGLAGKHPNSSVVSGHR